MTVNGVILRAILKIGAATLASLIGCMTAHVTMPILMLTPLSVALSTWIAFMDSSISQVKASGDLPSSNAADAGATTPSTEN